MKHICIIESNLQRILRNVCRDQVVAKYIFETIYNEFDTLTEFTYVSLIGISSPYMIDNSITTPAIDKLNRQHSVLDPNRMFIFSVSEIYDIPYNSLNFDVGVHLENLGIFNHNSSSQMVQTTIGAFLRNVLSNVATDVNSIYGRVLTQFICADKMLFLTSATE